MKKVDTKLQPQKQPFPKRLDNRKEYIKNHFVPEFLLKHFTRVNEPEVINVTDLLRNKTYPKNISDVCYEKYLNTVDYEKYISSEYESKYDRTIRKIKEFIYQGELDQPIPSDLLNEITDMVAFIHSHNLFWRKTMADEVSTSIMEKHDIESHTIDYRSQDIIPKQLFDFWKGELYCWTIIVIGNTKTTLNYITSDLPVVFFSLSSDMQTANNLMAYFEGGFEYDKNKKIKRFPFIDTINDNATFIFPVTSDTLIMGFKNNKTSDNMIPVINSWINNLDSHKIHRAFTNCVVLAAAIECVYSESQDDIKEINKYIRGFKNPFIHKTYNPYIQSFRDHKPKI